MIRALNQRSERTVLHLIFLTYLVILPVRVIKCDGVSENAKQVSVCDDGQVSRHFIFCYTYIGLSNTNRKGRADSLDKILIFSYDLCHYDVSF